MAVFEWPIRVYIEDTDLGGIVYYANYLKFMERGRTEWLRKWGFSQEILRQQNCLFVVQSLQLDYKHSARLDDELLVSVEITQLGRASMTITQQVSRQGHCLCQGSVRIACIQTDGKLRSLPDDIRSAVLAFMDGNQTVKETM